MDRLANEPKEFVWMLGNENHLQIADVRTGGTGANEIADPIEEFMYVLLSMR